MLLRHATLRNNLESIQRSRLLGRKSKGNLKVVWTHRSSKTPWALLHVAKRHGEKSRTSLSLKSKSPGGCFVGTAGDSGAAPRTSRPDGFAA